MATILTDLTWKEEVLTAVRLGVYVLGPGPWSYILHGLQPVQAGPTALIGQCEGSSPCLKGAGRLQGSLGRTSNAHAIHIAYPYTWLAKCQI